MNKFNKKILLFISAAVFVITGIYGSLFKQLCIQTREVITKIVQGVPNAIIEYRNTLDTISSTELHYHDQLMDLHSIKENLLGTRVVDKEETLVVKSDSGSLLGAFDNRIYSDEDIQNKASVINNTREWAIQSGAGYLCCSVPSKIFYNAYPSNIESNNKLNYDRVLAELSQLNIPHIDFMEALKEAEVPEEDIFFYTDHHWTPIAGLAATEIICEELKEKYGFSYNPDCYDLANYDVTTYPDHFLGSYGKKVGTYFTWHGADDFDVITPKFETNLTEIVPIYNRVRTGAFQDTMLDYGCFGDGGYSGNDYALYSGGDFRLQIMKNNLNPNGPKILMIRNSYACVVSPFLILNAGELHNVDIRAGGYPQGDIIDIQQYINQENFDYVIEIE